MNKKKKKKRCDAITRMRRVSISRARSSIRLAQEEKERVYFSFFHIHETRARSWTTRRRFSQGPRRSMTRARRSMEKSHL